MNAGNVALRQSKKMRFYKILIVVICSVAIFSCTPASKLKNTKTTSIGQLKLLNEYVIPNALQYKGTTVGGLSDIDYDVKNDVYYLVSDDRSAINPARFYKAKISISEKGIDTIEFVDVISLLDKNGNTYPSRQTDASHAPDPESMRYNPIRNELVWGSEGERIVTSEKTVIEDPAIYIINMNGVCKDSFLLPANMHMHKEEKGLRQNGVFEGITFTNDYKYLFASVEEPIYEDGARAGSGDSTAWVRFLKFDVKTKKQVAQYAYQVDAIPYPSNPAGEYKINGIPDILYIGDNKFIVIERAFSTGHVGNTVRIYLADVSGAADIANVNSLQSSPPVKPITKKLLINMDNLGRYIDNVEGVTFGPLLPNGHHTLIFAVDDNFEKTEKTQFFLFEVLP
ncbi:MAG: esterase-like activity of phytase family protein [Chitinophagaceae bacterium]